MSGVNWSLNSSAEWKPGRNFKKSKKTQPAACACGKAISANKKLCAKCAESGK